MTRFRYLISGLLLLALLAGGSRSVAQTSDDPHSQENPGYVVEGVTPGTPGEAGFLTGPQQGAPLDIALKYLQQNKHLLGLTGADLLDVVVTDQYTDNYNGVTHIYLQQRYKGIAVANANLNINIAADGSVINLGHSFVSNLAPAVNRLAPGRSAPQAVASAAQHLGLHLGQELHVIKEKGGAAQEVVFDNAGISLEPIPAKLVYQPIAANRVRLAWQLDIYELTAENWWSMVVDAENGEVLAQLNYVDHDNWGVVAANGAENRNGILLSQSASVNAAIDGASYNVFALPKESPNDGGRTLELNPSDSTASPFGWHDTNGAPGPEFTRTRGNNVHAYADRDNNNTPDPGSDPDGGAGLDFDFPLDLAARPFDSQPAIVTNLFYWNNIVHDVFYGYGFNEASGNFQVNNYGNGGVGGDDVRAEAQDGSGRNNANFGTPVDGLRPRMQMFEWRSSAPNPIVVNPPSPIAGTYFGPMAGFGESLVTTGPINGNVFLVNDGVGVTTDGCEPFAVPAGGIPLIDRGNCTFVIKVKNAQNAGAAMAIVANNIPGAQAIAMGGADPTIVIPSVMITFEDGSLFKANLPLTATISDGTGGAPDRDSDLDAGVIIHEYGHGISNRLTGGPATVSCLNNAEQMGEGWSDWLALVLTTDPADTATTRRGIGTYVNFEPVDGIGIRPAPYTTDMSVNPATYASVADTVNISQPHGIGYVWASMLWEVYWNLVGKQGYNADVYADWTTGGNNLAIQLVMDGMKLQACRPGFVDGRNAILQADVVLTGGVNQCEIWEGFAKRGLGFSASQGSSLSRTDGVAAFDLPASCIPTLSLNDPASAQYSDPVSLSATVSPPVFGGQPVTGSVEFFIDNVSVGSSSIDSNGLATLSVPNNRAAGSYNVTATFTPSGPAGVNSSSAGPKALTVTKENATSSYTGDQFVTTAGPNINSASVVLSANLVQQDDGYPGDLSQARIVFELFKAANSGSTPDLSVGDVPVDASGNAVTTAILSADIWTVKVKVEPGNSYWTSTVDTSTLTVAVGSTDRRVTGGGWVPDSASSNNKSNFGFTVNPLKNGNPKGNSVFVIHGKDGYDYVVKSTSWQAGSLAFLGDPVASARFSGRATVQKIDRVTGEIVASFGNYSFIVEIGDGDLFDPRGADTYGITVLDNNGNIWHQVGGTNAPIEIGGGNVAIKGN